jgi:hypothetical protein
MHVQYFTRDSMIALLGGIAFSVRSIATDPKVFSVRYKAEFLGGYCPWGERLGGILVDRLRLADRPIGPDLRDRMAVLATVPPAGQQSA